MRIDIFKTDQTRNKTNTFGRNSLRLFSSPVNACKNLFSHGLTLHIFSQ
jgi:hypothetical protein